MCSNTVDLDLQAIDLKSLSPDEWSALKQNLIRRAHQERSQQVAALAARLAAWLRRSPATLAPEAGAAPIVEPVLR